MSLQKSLLVAIVLGAGFLGGLVVSGKLSLTSTSEAVPEWQARPAPPPAAGAALANLPDFSAVAERAVRASVNISSTQQVAVHPFFQQFYGADAVQPQSSLGSGVLVSAEGFILTNSHVVQDRRAEVRVTLADDRELDATVIGIDELTDLAVLKVKVTGAAPLPWGDSSKLRLAEWVLAVGNPFQFNETVTAGIVSAVNRHAPQLDWYNDFIQTDAAINPGNSGGPLINTRGELVGINTMIYSQTGGYQGIGFAIPSNLAKSIMDQLIANGEILRGSIGSMRLRAVDGRASSGDRVQGVQIINMWREEPAFRAGLKPGDVIVSFNGTPIKDEGQFMRLMVDSKVGSIAKVEVIREGQRRSFDVPVARMAPPRRRT
jgi:S1-C subfamily serine protease